MSLIVFLCLSVVGVVNVFVCLCLMVNGAFGKTGLAFHDGEVVSMFEFVYIVLLLE